MVPGPGLRRGVAGHRADRHVARHGPDGTRPETASGTRAHRVRRHLGPLLRQGQPSPLRGDGGGRMKVLASYSIKGGVGKTTAATNLAWLAASEGRRVLLWDLDPQGGSTFLFRVAPKVKGGGEALVSGKRDLMDAIKASDFEN